MPFSEQITFLLENFAELLFMCETSSQYQKYSKYYFNLKIFIVHSEGLQISARVKVRSKSRYVYDLI
jgi:hypothetical protein